MRSLHLRPQHLLNNIIPVVPWLHMSCLFIYYIPKADVPCLRKLSQFEPWDDEFFIDHEPPYSDFTVGLGNAKYLFPGFYFRQRSISSFEVPDMAATNPKVCCRKSSPRRPRSPTGIRRGKHNHRLPRNFRGRNYEFCYPRDRNMAMQPVAIGHRHFCRRATKWDGPTSCPQPCSGCHRLLGALHGGLLLIR